MAELIDGVLTAGPIALPPQGADPAFGAAVGLRLVPDGRVVGDA
jgi:hypothetical protein